MRCADVGAKFRNQYLLHMMPNLGWVFPLGQGDGCLPVAGKFLGIAGQNPSDSKSSWLHVDIFRFCYIHLRYSLYIPLK